MADLLDGLNPPQREAAAHRDGPLLILAGAGSGKTRVLTRRMAHLVEQGVKPWHIMAVTFTNKAAGEMKERVSHALQGSDTRGMLVTTFHSACVRFLRRDIDKLGYSRSFTILDTDDQRRLMKQISTDLRLDSKMHTPAKLASAIDRAKNAMKGPDDLAEETRLQDADTTVRVYRAYQQRLKQLNAVDFNDLLNLTVRLWQQSPDVLAQMHDRVRYLMVDEYQDTNLAQYALVQLLSQKHRNVAVVGDDDQSIYGFRGANVRNILDFERDFPDAKVVRLEQNYRSTGHILKAASAVVRNNESRMEKELWTDLGDGEKVTLRTTDTEQQEAQEIVRRIRTARNNGDRYGDMAVIYRTNAASRVIEQALVRVQIPHVLVGARKFFERREIRDVLAYLRLVINPVDDMSVLRVINVPARGIGAKSMDSLRAWARDQGVPLLEAARSWGQQPGRGRKGALEFVALMDAFTEAAPSISPGELVVRIVEETGIGPQLREEKTIEAQGRLDNLQELARALEEDEDIEDPLERLTAFIDRASLAGQSDELPDDDEAGRVTLLTAHLAKGLEFDHVHVVGMCEGGFPHFRAREKESDIAEERRLVYVAFTRARRHLHLTRPRRKLLPGVGFRDVDPSRFLSEIPTSTLDTGRFGTASGGYRAPAGLEVRSRTVPASRPARSSQPAPQFPESDVLRTVEPESPEDFSVGTFVNHAKFGRGQIRRADGPPHNLKLTIYFERVGPKTVYAKYANLELLLT